MLRLPEITLRLEVLREEQVRLLQQLLPILRHQPHHAVVLALFFVHVDGEIGLLDGEEEPLGLLELPEADHPLGLGDVQHRHLPLRHESNRQLVSLLPLVVLRVHLHRQLGGPRELVELLRLLQLLRLLEVLGDALEVRFALVGIEVLHELCRLEPLARVERGFDSLGGAVGLDVVVDGHVHLLRAHEIVAPLLLEGNNL
mmetsp:Transcript_64778/g.88967  ORF Transcript_64778/g.88967 Transcript_64778/m.88967 type:complete len:200 (-) Transcript_64778:420-1019(-)